MRGAGEYGEAPILAALVRKGELPPVDDRLPVDPMVVDLESIGVYGGELYYPSTYTYAMNVWIRESLTMFKKGTQDPIPSLARAVEVSSDGRDFTFYLREGHKWSDGEPFTADDLLFWWNDIITFEDFTSAPPTWMKSGGELATMEKIDDTTVVFRFAEPYPLFPKILAFRGAYEFERVPKHYLKQFHPNYTDTDTLERLADRGDFDSWAQLFQSEYSSDNPECPTVTAWDLTTRWPESRMIWERNAYYYKVDQAGNQLPYIDRVVSEQVANSELAILKVLDGQTDFQYKFMGFDNYPMLKENEDAGGYRVLQWQNCEGWICAHVNQNFDDPVKGEILRNKEFRYALSYAMNRDRINELLTFGMADISQIHPLELDIYYDPSFGDTALDYDVAEANRLLDRIGLSERDKDGYRLMPNGKRLELTIETFDFESGAQAVEYYELVAEDWDEIGIKTTTKLISSELLRQRWENGQVDVAGYTAGGVPGYAWDISPGDYVPIEWNWYAPQWGFYYQSGGKEGIEPPPYVKDLWGIYEDFQSETDAQQRLQLGKRLVREGMDEHLWSIALVKIPFQPVIVNKNLRNVLEDGVMSWFLHHEGQTWFETLYFVDGRRK